MNRVPAKQLAWVTSLGAAVVLLSARPATAQTPCDTASTQLAVQACAADEAHEAERRLQRWCRKLRSRSAPPERPSCNASKLRGSSTATSTAPGTARQLKVAP